MKRLNFLILAAVSIASLTGCSGVSPSGDEEAVLIEKPWIFGHGGVDDDPVTSGNKWVAVSTDNVKFVITPVKYTELFENLMTSDNNPVTFDVYFTFQIEKGKSSILYKGWGVKWYDNTMQPSLRTMVRDKASPFQMFALTTNREISSGIEKDLVASINTLIKTIKDKDGHSIPLVLISVSVGAITPPKDVIEETSKTAAQLQAKRTQDARINTEKARKDADVQKGLADLAYMQTMGMNIEQYLHLREIEISKETVELAKENKSTSMNFIVGQRGANFVTTAPTK